MNQHFVDFQAKFRTTELLVHRTACWTWSVRGAQPTLGAGVLSLNRYALELHDMTRDETADLATMLSVAELTLRKVFDYRIMNYLALMMVDRHVHYHMIPRYDGSREFGGAVWVDAGWPALPVLADAQHGGDEMLMAIRDRLRAGLVL